MLSTISICCCLGGLLFIIKELVITAFRNHKAHQFFEKKCPNLPMAPNRGLFGGHINEVVWVKTCWRKSLELHNKLGKTFGLYYCDKPVVSTLDADLIKAMVLDKPDDHLDRFQPNTPVVEMENDCVLTCKTEQWRRLRIAIAPAFR